MPARYPDPPATFDRSWAAALTRTLEERDRGATQAMPVRVPAFTASHLGEFSMRSNDVGSIAWCTDAAGGAQLAVWNGSAWVKVADGAAI